MNPIANKIANWHYADGFRKDLTFDGGRSMILVAASAYNAGGMIGSEYNGLVVIDSDNNSIVLEKHLLESSGSAGPSRRQAAEFERIAGMTQWRDFAAWLKSTPGFKGGVPDIDEAYPTIPTVNAVVLKAARYRTVPGLPGEDILPVQLREAHDSPENGYEYPHRTRLDMAAFIAGHTSYRERYRDTHLAWNIKVHGADMSGKVEGGEARIDPALDELWTAHAEARYDELFWDACRDGIREYVDGEATTYPGTDQGDFAFETRGRQGGYLVLTEWRGNKMGFGGHDELVDMLLDMEPADLAALYGAIVCLDKDIQPERVFADNMAFLREKMEEDWADPDVAEEAARELGLEDWVHPSRAAAPAPM